jgi:hypothetical protein
MKKAIFIFCVVFTISQLALGLTQQNREPRKRVKRPVINKQNSAYFDNVFKEALIGNRPAPLTAAAIAKGKKPTSPTGESGATEGTTPKAGSGVWSKIISAEDIQSELKLLSVAMNQQVTSPGKFKSGGNRDVRQTASMIAVMFGVIAEFDGDVKWKPVAAGARDSFAQCAQSSTTTSTAAYQQAKNRKEDLLQILNGGPFTPPVKPGEDFEWASVVVISELMKRLESSYREKIKPWIADEQSYKKNFKELMHEAAVLAVISEVLKKESMENAENDDYIEFCDSLRAGALSILNSASVKDYSLANKGSGMISQSCDNCHSEYN